MMNPDINILGFFLGGPELAVLFVLGPLLGLWIWSLLHCIRNKDLSDTNRIIGILLIVFLFVIGSLVYLFIPRETNS